MFGLTIEKLFVVMICATLILGPQRLPLYAGKIAGIVRGLRGYVEATKRRAENEMGVPLSRADWEALDLRQYDPRSIMRDALASSPESADGNSVRNSSAEANPDDSTLPATAQPIPAEPRGRWEIRGDAAHPRRVFIPDPQATTYPATHAGDDRTLHVDPSVAFSASQPTRTDPLDRHRAVIARPRESSTHSSPETFAETRLR